MTFGRRFRGFPLGTHGRSHGLRQWTAEINEDMRKVVIRQQPVPGQFDIHPVARHLVVKRQLVHCSMPRAAHNAKREDEDGKKVHQKIFYKKTANATSSKSSVQEIDIRRLGAGVDGKGEEIGADLAHNRGDQELGFGPVRYRLGSVHAPDDVKRERHGVAGIVAAGRERAEPS